MKMNITQVWLLTLAVSFFVAFGLGAVLAASFAEVSGMGLIIGLTIFAFFWVIILAKGYYETPNNHVDMVERFGEYIGKPKEAGPHLLYPFFKFETIHARVFLGQQKLDLELKNGSVDSGDVEFKDCSSPIYASFFFQVEDP